MIGVIVLLILGIIGIVAVNHLRFINRINQEIDALFKQSRSSTPHPPNPPDYQNQLPDLVKSYLAFAHPSATIDYRFVRLKQSGFLRLSAEQPWKPFTAEQYFALDTPSFVWRAKVNMFPFVWVMTRDRYFQHTGNMLIKLLSTVTIADATGDKIDSGALIRFIAEMMWFPTFFRDTQTLQWQTIDETTVKACGNDHGVKGSVHFHFDANGAISKIVSYDRFKDANDKHPTLWYGYVRQYAEFGGIRIPSEIEVGWETDEGYYSWLKFTITELEYDVPERYT